MSCPFPYLEGDMANKRRHNCQDHLDEYYPLGWYFMSTTKAYRCLVCGRQFLGG